MVQFKFDNHICLCIMISKRQVKGMVKEKQKRATFKPHLWRHTDLLAAVACHGALLSIFYLLHSQILNVKIQQNSSCVL